MSKRKRIKALPVCSETLREKCVVATYCVKSAFKSHCKGCAVYDYDGRKDFCGCIAQQRNGRGCPYFRKAVDK